MDVEKLQITQGFVSERDTSRFARDTYKRRERETFRVPCCEDSTTREMT